MQYLSLDTEKSLQMIPSTFFIKAQNPPIFVEKNWIGWIEDRWRVEIKKKGGKDKIESHETSFSQLMKPGIALQLKTDG